MAHRIEHKQATLIELLIEEVLMSWNTKGSVVVSLRLLEYVFPLHYRPSCRKGKCTINLTSMKRLFL